MEEENGFSTKTQMYEICHTCNNQKKKGEYQLVIQESTESGVAQGQTINKEKVKASLTNPFSNKLHNFKQIFESTKINSSSTECLEKKGLLQRMHSLSLLKSKEKITCPVSQKIPICQCDSGIAENTDTRFHTWPERGRDKVKSPKKTSVETRKEVEDCIPDDVFQEELPVLQEPYSKQLKLIQTEVLRDEPLFKKDMGHRRQPSLLSNVSSSGSEVHLPLMPLNSNPHSHTSLSSLSNYSSSTDFTEHTNSLERSCEPPRFGLASFWQRAFNRKSENDNSASWKLFSRTSFFQKSRSGQSSCSSLNSGSSPTLNTRSIGSTGLILHSRPSFLPAKCPEEELHHQFLHHKLLEESQRREQTKIQEKEKRIEELCKQEEQVASAAKIWTSEILPQWDTTRKCRKTRDLWWQGLPPSIRGQVWKLSIGNDLNVTSELFALCLERAKEKLINAGGVGLESSVEGITLDLSRTFPHLGIFQKGGPYHDVLGDLLSAYVCFRPDIGYVQGMSYLAATLLLNQEVSDAFISFSNLLNRPLLHAFFRLDHAKMADFYASFEVLLKSQLPKVYSHFLTLNLTPDLYLQEWIYTLYTRSLPLDLASRVWDVYCRDGDDVIFRIAIGILKLYESTLLESDFIHSAQLLTNLPEDIDGIKLFKIVEQIGTYQEKSRFTQILTNHFKVKGHT